MAGRVSGYNGYELCQSGTDALIVSKKKPDILMILTIVASVGIVLGATAIVVLYRFTNLLAPKTTEKRIAENLDLNDSEWTDRLMELSLPSFKKDFPLYEAFSNLYEKKIVTQVYATRADLNDIRSHYKELLENPRLSERNDVAVLEIEGKINDRKIMVMNYFSEVSNIIHVEMEISGEYADLIGLKIAGAFPSNALAEVPEIAAFATGESAEGYVMYNFDTYASDVYANVPLFSRAYSFNGTITELKEKINSLGERYTNSSVIS
jgi:hypothetical protein